MRKMDAKAIQILACRRLVLHWQNARLRVLNISVVMFSWCFAMSLLVCDAVHCLSSRLSYWVTGKEIAKILDLHKHRIDGRITKLACGARYASKRPARQRTFCHAAIMCAGHGRQRPADARRAPSVHHPAPHGDVANALLVAELALLVAELELFLSM